MQNTIKRFVIFRSFTLICIAGMFNISVLMAQQDFLHFVEDTIEFVEHPLSSQFDFKQNNLVIKKSSKDLAATFDDPSRVLYRHSGISIQNDQNNAIIYRGLPSEYMRWSIDGAEILNPNHLSNAGRITDQVSPAAGGVLAIPFDVINSFNFYGNPYDNSMFSSLSGVGEFNFNSRSDNFVKLGLLGMEAGLQTEDNLATKAHFRYSTVGLLSDLGVDFDGEAIKFYDGFVQTEITDKLTFIGSMGVSSNNKTSVADSSAIEEFKDLQDINFESKFWIAGLTYKTDNQSHSAFFSKRYMDRVSRSNFVLDENLARAFNASTLSDHSMFSYNGRYRWLEGKRIYKLNTQFNVSELDEDLNFIRTNDYHDSFVRAAGSVQQGFQLGQFNVLLSPDIAVNYHFNHRMVYLEPALNASFEKGKHQFNLNASFKYRNVIDRPNNPVMIPGPVLTRDILARNISSSLAYKYVDRDNNLLASVRAFYMKIETGDLLFDHLRFNEPLSVLKDPVDWYGTVNNNPTRAIDSYDNQGIEFMLEKSWDNGWYFNANASYMDITYDEEDFFFDPDINYSYNLLLTKAMSMKNASELIINLAFHGREGARSYAYNPESDTFDGGQLDDYRRLDLRIQHRLKKSTWTLDIQNVSNIANDGYYRYDPYLNQVVLEKQLTMIPILSWRRQF